MNVEDLAKKAITTATEHLGGSLQKTAAFYLHSAENLMARGEYWSAARHALTSLGFSVEVTTPVYRELQREVHAAFWNKM